MRHVTYRGFDITTCSYERKPEKLYSFLARYAGRLKSLGINRIVHHCGEIEEPVSPGTLVIYTDIDKLDVGDYKPERKIRRRIPRWSEAAAFDPSDISAKISGYFDYIIYYDSTRDYYAAFFAAIPSKSIYVLADVTHCFYPSLWEVVVRLMEDARRGTLKPSRSRPHALYYNPGHVLTQYPLAKVTFPEIKDADCGGVKVSLSPNGVARITIPLNGVKVEKIIDERGVVILAEPGELLGEVHASLDLTKDTISFHGTVKVRVGEELLYHPNVSTSDGEVCFGDEEPPSYNGEELCTYARMLAEFTRRVLSVPNNTSAFNYQLSDYLEEKPEAIAKVAPLSW